MVWNFIRPYHRHLTLYILYCLLILRLLLQNVNLAPTLKWHIFYFHTRWKMSICKSQIWFWYWKIYLQTQVHNIIHARCKIITKKLHYTSNCNLSKSFPILYLEIRNGDNWLKGNLTNLQVIDSHLSRESVTSLIRRSINLKCLVMLSMVLPSFVQYVSRRYSYTR